MTELLEKYKPQVHYLLNYYTDEQIGELFGDLIPQIEQRLLMVKLPERKGKGRPVGAKNKIQKAAVVAPVEPFVLPERTAKEPPYVFAVPLDCR